MALALEETTAGGPGSGFGRLGSLGDEWGGNVTSRYALASRRLLLGGQRSSLERVYPPSTEVRRAKMGLRALPTIALTCGGNIPCQEAVPSAPMAGAVGQLGALFCPELDTVLDRLYIALGRVPPVPKGKPADPRYEAAARFFLRNRSTFGGPVVGESCKNAVTEGQRLLSDLNELLAERNRPMVAPPELEVSGESGPAEQLSKVRTALVAVAVIVGGLVVLPPVWRLAFSRGSR